MTIHSRAPSLYFTHRRIGKKIREAD